ncbi:MAG TPA: HAD family hydrolase [Gaiellaceae bacterium]|jgi:putative hydrolase of the HAD superfamily
MVPRAAIFDLWGTLVHFDGEGWQRTLTSIAEVLGVPREEFEHEWKRDYHRRLVSDLHESLERVCRTLGVTRAGAIEDGLNLRNQFQREMFVPRADAVSTLRGLHDSGCLTGLITNCSSEAPALVGESPLAGLFDVEVFSCSVGLRKPQRAIYELASTQLEVDPRLCLFVGDGNDQELEGARDAGMKAVLLRPGDTRLPEDWQGPEITSLAEVLTLVP